jgi:hypothetical protein
MTVPADVARAHVEAELAQLETWRDTHGWEIEWDAATLVLTILMSSKIDGEKYLLECRLDGYRALPPMFEFVHPQTGERGKAGCYPGGGRGYFHTKPCICAPWNRSAYQVHGGPHGDWTMTAWATYRPNHSQLGDMIVLIQDLLDDRSSYSGRMAR